MPVNCIIPSQVVADVLKRSHETWLKTPGVRTAASSVPNPT